MSNDIALIAECDDSYKRTENWKKTIQCYTCGRIEHIAREYQNKGNGKYKLNAQGGPEKELTGFFMRRFSSDMFTSLKLAQNILTIGRHLKPKLKVPV